MHAGHRFSFAPPCGYFSGDAIKLCADDRWFPQVVVDKFLVSLLQEIQKLVPSVDTALLFVRNHGASCRLDLCGQHYSSIENVRPGRVTLDGDASQLYADSL